MAEEIPRKGRNFQRRADLVKREYIAGGLEGHRRKGQTSDDPIFCIFAPVREKQRRLNIAEFFLVKA